MDTCPKCKGNRTILYTIRDAMGFHHNYRVECDICLGSGEIDCTCHPTFYAGELGDTPCALHDKPSTDRIPF